MQTDTQAPRQVDLEVDLLVVGCGMAGMSAAAYATQHGCRVMAVDKAPDIGGSAVLSGTTLWTAPSHDAFQQLCPRGDLTLGRVIVDDFPQALEWVRSTGAELSGERSVVRFGRGHRFDVLGFFERCRAIIEAAGGWVLPKRVVRRLVLDHGRVVGAEVSDEEGVVTISAAAVLLATGGFQADSEMRKLHLGDDLLLRSNPHSTGDGLRLASEVGAATSGDFSAFYGHSMAAPLASLEPGDFSRMAVQYTSEGVVVNVAGDRFVDESQCDHVTAQELVRQPQGRGLTIVDQKVLRSPSLGRSRVIAGPDHVDRTPEDVFGDPIRAGANVAAGNDLNELGKAVSAWGFDGARMATTVRSFNANLERNAQILPDRKWHRIPVDSAPFWAVEVRPAVTFTLGGLAVDVDARVLQDDGSPIEGLFAAGADIGGVYEGGYAGGLALALVFAHRATRALLADRQIGVGRGSA